MKHTLVYLTVAVSLTLCIAVTMVALRSETGHDEWHITTSGGQPPRDNHWEITFVTREGFRWETTDTKTLTYHALRIPYWSLIALFCTPTIFWLWSERKRRKLRAAGFCVDCGYDLRASPDRCPECGAVQPALKVASPVENG